jgi:hypothetical protein
VDNLWSMEWHLRAPVRRRPRKGNHPGKNHFQYCEKLKIVTDVLLIAF